MTVALDKKRFGPWALVTGASSGIGKEFAQQIAASGINIVLEEHRAQTAPLSRDSVRAARGPRRVGVGHFQCNRKQMVETDSRKNCGRRLWVFSVC